MRADTRASVRRSWPVVVVLVLVAIAMVRWTGAVAGGESRDALDSRLADAGAGTNSAMLDTERDQLTALRAFTFSAGVAEALEAGDVKMIEQLLSPVDANLGIPMVDVLDTTGKVVFAFRGDGEVPPIYRERSSLGIVQRALRGEPDRYGERFTTLVVSDEGALVASVGAVKLDDAVVGAVLVMTPLGDVLGASANQHGEMLTVYSGDGGVPLATTAPVKPRTLPTKLGRLLPADRLPVTSSFDVPGGHAREQLGALIIRHEAVAWLGVADEDEAGRVGGEVSLLTAVALVCCIALTALLALRWRRPQSKSPVSDPGHDTEVRKPVELGPADPKATVDPITSPVGAGQRRW